LSLSFGIVSLITQTPKGSVVSEKTIGKARTIHEQFTGFVINVNF
jgi:hypothetical protein